MDDFFAEYAPEEYSEVGFLFTTGFSSENSSLYSSSGGTEFFLDDACEYCFEEYSLLFGEALE